MPPRRSRGEGKGSMLKNVFDLHYGQVVANKGVVER